MRPADHPLTNPGFRLSGPVEIVVAATLLKQATDLHTPTVSGLVFSVGSDQQGALRLSFATTSPDELVEGARRLRSAVEAWSPGSPDRSPGRPVATTASAS